MLLFHLITFTLIAPGTITVLLPWLVVSSDARATLPLGALRGSGVPFLLIGMLIYIHCAWNFYKAHGTPAPYKAPTELVAEGLYRYTRNPMYVGMMSILTGEILLFQSISLMIYAAIAWLAFHLRVLLYEEPVLREQFGDSFVEYCRQVPRWMPRRR